jgi:hypothetical protein
MVKDFKRWTVYASGVGDLFNGVEVPAYGMDGKNGGAVDRFADSVPAAVKTLYEKYGLPSCAGALMGIVSIDGTIGVNIEFSFGGSEDDDKDIVRRAARKTAEFISKETGYDIYDLNDHCIDYDLFIPYSRVDDFISKNGNFDNGNAMWDFTDRYYTKFNAYLSELSSENNRDGVPMKNMSD